MAFRIRSSVRRRVQQQEDYDTAGCVGMMKDQGDDDTAGTMMTG